MFGFPNHSQLNYQDYFCSFQYHQNLQIQNHLSQPLAVVEFDTGVIDSLKSINSQDFLSQLELGL